MRLLLVINLALAVSMGQAFAGDPPVLKPTILKLFPYHPGMMVAGIERETGVKLSPIPEPIATESRGRDEKTFWEAVRELERDIKGSVEIPAEGLAWKLASQPGGVNSQISLSGPFRLELREIRSVRQFREATSRTELILQLAWEPRYPVCRVDSHPRLAKLTDDLGHSYPLEEQPRRTGARGNFATLTLPIADVPRAAKELAVIEGKVQVTACPEMKTAQFKHLKERTKIADADSEVQLLGFRKEGKYWTADIGIKYLARDMAEFESFERERIGLHRAVLISPSGTEYAPTGFEEADGRFAFRFEEDPKRGLKIYEVKGWSLKYRYPGTWVEVAVPFRFEKIGLP